MIPSTAKITSSTTAAVSKGIGWSKGIASQVSLPSISAPRTQGRRTERGSGPRVLRPLGRLVDDALEKLRVDGAIGCRGVSFARFRQRGIAGVVECGAGSARL